MWKLDLEDDYFYKIYDSKRQIAGYFDPDYGNTNTSEEELEKIYQMHKNSDRFTRGFLTLPMVKFGVFSEKSLTVDTIYEKIQSALIRIEHWKKFMSTFSNGHSVTVSHTDQDMLSITLEIRFTPPIPLNKKIIQEKLIPTLNTFHSMGLL